MTNVTVFCLSIISGDIESHFIEKNILQIICCYEIYNKVKEINQF